MNSITVSELKEWMDQGIDFQLIDVREIHEYETANINGLHIPLGEIPNRFTEIEQGKQVVMQCRSGVRSANAIAYLAQNHAYNNLLNLEGGIMAWAREIDPSLDVQ